jgi:drug/metabolite transporter (DMT)-like permease
MNWGVVLTCMCVVAYTVQIVYTGEVSEQIGAGRLTLGSFVVTGLTAWVAVLIMEPAAIPVALKSAAASASFWKYFALLVLAATIGAMLLMNLYQRYVRPSEAAVIYTSEPLFAGAFALIFIGWSELPDTAGLIGAALMIGANLVVALKSRAGRQNS